MDYFSFTEKLYTYIHIFIFLIFIFLLLYFKCHVINCLATFYSNFKLK